MLSWNVILKNDRPLIIIIIIILKKGAPHTKSTYKLVAWNMSNFMQSFQGSKHLPSLFHINDTKSSPRLNIVRYFNLQLPLRCVPAAAKSPWESNFRSKRQRLEMQEMLFFLGCFFFFLLGCVEKLLFNENRLKYYSLNANPQ